MAASSALAAADVTRLRAPTTVTGLLGTDGSQVLFPFQLSAGATLSYGYHPLVWRYEDGTYDPVIANQLTIELVGAMGIVRCVEAETGNGAAVDIDGQFLLA